MVCQLYDLGLTVDSGYGFELRDIFTGEVRGPYNDYFFVPRMQPHEIKVYKAKLVKM